MKSVAVVGATGYTGLELCRLLAAHPNFKVTSVYSQQAAGLTVSEKFPHFSHISSLEFKSFSEAELPQEDIIFYALPHCVTNTFLGNAHREDQYIIDLSADFRLNNPDNYIKYYNYTHPDPASLTNWVLGFTELFREDISKTRRVANPGCYSTAAVLGLLPLVKSQKFDSDSFVINAVSGVSGAGKALKETTLFCEASGNVMAYGTGSHRHISEIDEVTGVDVVFSPHLVPMDRGILASIYVKSTSDITQGDLEGIYTSFYSDSHFVDLKPSSIPASTKWVRGSNFVNIWVKKLEGNRAAIFVAIDNLVKGAAGQAIQNANVMIGLPEETGLDFPALSL